MSNNLIKAKNNFDLIRLLLSLTVFFVHSFVLSQRSELAFISIFLNSEVAVNAFFVISGFLVSMSFENSSSNSEYFVKRARRIYPAYVCVILCSVIAGFWLTNLAFAEYLSLDILKYLAANLSFLNLIQLTLPGVFLNNYEPAVNNSLWTIRFEVVFYVVIPLLGALVLKYNKKIIFIVLFILILIASVFLSLMADNFQFIPFKLLCTILPKIFLYFICGSFLYFSYNEFKKYSVLLFIFSIPLYIIFRITDFLLFMPFVVGFIVIFVACEFHYFGNWGKFGDFSYGIYIWHCPVLQTFISFHFFEKSPYFALLLSTITVIFLAFISWHVIEKSFLKRTSHYILTSISENKINGPSFQDKNRVISPVKEVI